MTTHQAQAAVPVPSLLDEHAASVDIELLALLRRAEREYGGNLATWSASEVDDDVRMTGQAAHAEVERAQEAGSPVRDGGEWLAPFAYAPLGTPLCVFHFPGRPVSDGGEWLAPFALVF